MRLIGSSTIFCAFAGAQSLVGRGWIHEKTLDQGNSALPSFKAAPNSARGKAHCGVGPNCATSCRKGSGQLRASSSNGTNKVFPGAAAAGLAVTGMPGVGRVGAGALGAGAVGAGAAGAGLLAGSLFALVVGLPAGAAGAVGGAADFAAGEAGATFGAAAGLAGVVCREAGIDFSASAFGSTRISVKRPPEALKRSGTSSSTCTARWLLRRAKAAEVIWGKISFRGRATSLLSWALLFRNTPDGAALRKSPNGTFTEPFGSCSSACFLENEKDEPPAPVAARWPWSSVGISLRIAVIGSVSISASPVASDPGRGPVATSAWALAAAVATALGWGDCAAVSDGIGGTDTLVLLFLNIFLKAPNILPARKHFTSQTRKSW
jgi:hypothetical protein